MKTVKSNKGMTDWKVTIIIIFIFSALFLLRATFLDQDMPPWGITNYTPVDEGSYSILALNAINYGKINLSHNVLQYDVFTPAHVRVNIIGNMVSYWSLLLFGDTYYGLRMGYVFFGLLNFIVFSLNLNLIRKKYGTNSALDKNVVRFAQLYLLCDFIFFISNRVAEPSLVRMLFIQLVLYVFMKLKDHKYVFLLCSFITTIGIFGVYVTNLFVMMALGLLSIYADYKLYKERKQNLKADEKKHFVPKNVIFVFCGFFAAIAFLETYYMKVWGTSSVVNMFSAVFDFSSSAGYTSSASMLLIFKNIMKFFSANSLLYNLQLLGGFLVALPVVIYSVWNKKDKIMLFQLLILGSYLLQTMVSEDYVVRKFLIVFGLVFYLLVIAFYQRKEIPNMRSSLANKWGERRYAIIEKVYFLAVAIGCIVVYAFRLFILRDGTTLDFTTVDKAIILLFGLLPCIFGLKVMYDHISANLSSNKSAGKLLTGAMSLGIVLNVLFIGKYVMLSHTYSERDNMIELGRIANNQFVLGEYENGFTLYNSIKPVINTYDVLRKNMEQNNQLYYFDYYDDNDPGMRTFFDDIIFKGSAYTVVPVQEFKREFQTFGKKRSMALYKVMTKRDAVALYKASAEKKKAYPDIVNDVYGSLETVIYNNIRANVYGNINSKIYGNIEGNIYGDINGDVYGNIDGDIYGSINGNIFGQVKGIIKGEVKGHIITPIEKQN